MHARYTQTGIIREGRSVASASIKDLRAGVDVPGTEGKATLEQIFLRVVGGARVHTGELSWL